MSFWDRQVFSDLIFLYDDPLFLCDDVYFYMIMYIFYMIMYIFYVMVLIFYVICEFLCLCRRFLQLTVVRKPSAYVQNKNQTPSKGLVFIFHAIIVEASVAFVVVLLSFPSSLLILYLLL